MKITIEIDSGDIEKWRKRINKAFDNPAFFETVVAAMGTPPFVETPHKAPKVRKRTKPTKSRRR